MAARQRSAHRAEPAPRFMLSAGSARGTDIALVLFATFAFWNLAFNLVPAFTSGPLADGSKLGADWTQWALMPLLAATLWLATRTGAARPRVVRLSLVALAFSFLGDALPDALSGDASFYAMLGSFLCAQIAYIVAFWPYWRESLGRRRPWTLGVYGAVVVGLVVALAGGAGAMLPAVIVYGICLATMAVLASGVHPIAGVGGALFLVSDALIAVGRYSDVELWGMGFWVMATYIAGQFLIAEGVIRRARYEREAARRDAPEPRPRHGM